MIDLVKYLVTQIVDNPDNLQIREEVDENGSHLITLTVHPDDMGKVIGKGGKIISAIREIVKVKAIKLQKRVRVILKDPDEFNAPAIENSPEPTKTVEEVETVEEIQPENSSEPEDLTIDLPTQTDSLSPSEPQE